MRVLSMGVYPIQRLNSQVSGQDDVSNERVRTLMTTYFHQKKKINKRTTSVYLT